MKKLLYIFGFATLLLFCFQQEAMAQKNYNTSVGLRIGIGYGITVKHFLSESVSIEGIFSSRYYGTGRGYGRKNYKYGYAGFNLTALIQKHWSIGEVRGLNWFIGGGAHIGGNGYDGTPYTVIGLDGNIGLEYTVPNAPVTFQLDYKPSINFYTYYDFGYDEIALSIRYAF